MQSTRPTPPAFSTLYVALVLLAAALPRATLAQPRPAGASILEAQRILFLGDSITYAGQYVDLVETVIRLHEPDTRARFFNLGLPSETVSGLSEPGHAGGAFPRPDLHERLGRILERLKPDLIVACYGMNDGIYHPHDDARLARFQDGIRRLRQAATEAGAKILHLTPPVFDPVPIRPHTLPAGLDAYPQPYEGYNAVLDRFAQWLLAQRTAGWDVVDVHGPMQRFLDARRHEDPAFRLADDGVHAGPVGHWLIAREILRRLGLPDRVVLADDPETALAVHPRAEEVLNRVRQRQRLLKDTWLTRAGHLRPGMNPGRPLEEIQPEVAAIEAELPSLAQNPFPGRRSVWNDFDRYDFLWEGRPVVVVAPHRERPGRPWIWHGEFFGHRPDPDLALLGRGFHVVYLGIPDMLGSPAAVALWNGLYRELTTRHRLGLRPALVGLSRGGLYCYNWAIANPNRVACLYGDAPVCDFRSWPGGQGDGEGSPRDWQLVLDRYGFATEDEALSYRGNPVDNLAPLAARKVPLLHVYGDADEIVPWRENTGVVAERYRQLGGPITLIAKPGVGHHPHGLEDSTPIVEFLWRHAAHQPPSEDEPLPDPSAAPADPGPLDASGRPLIRKLGTLDLDLVETTPVVFQDRLWRFEWVRHDYWANDRATNHFRFVDRASGKTTPPFADGYEFGSAFIEHGTVFVTGTTGRSGIDLFVSTNLLDWEIRPVLPAGRYGVFNTSLCRTADDYVLMFEIDRPPEETGAAFTARFLRSPDLRTWTLTAPECHYARDRYTAPHALRWLDGWFYNFYLEAHRGYEMRVVRSRDLIEWHPSPLNPVLRASPTDRVVNNPRLTVAQRQRLASAVNRNNSDLDFTDWQGRLVMTYSWGNQLGVEHLAEAVYDGTLSQFLRGWFPE